MTAVDGQRWRNWAGTESADPARTATPRHVGELADAVRAAVRDGLRVKAVGAGHSFTGVAVTDGLHLQLDRMAGPVRVDVATGVVTVPAGVPLHRLNALLDRHGLAMPNLGDIDRQTLAGALGTGTHGTGARLGGLAAQVLAFDLLTADGAVLHCSAGENADVFAAARVGLGAFGVLTSVTLRCVPAFTLRAMEAPWGLDAILESFDELADAEDHVEFYWFPHTALTSVKRNTRVAAAPSPPGRLRGWVDDELLANRLFEVANRLGAAVPALVPTLSALAAQAVAAREYVDVSHRVFVSPRRVVFREAEWALPRDAVAGVLRDVRRWIERSGEPIAFPVEVRVAAADDVWLSTAYQRDSAYLAVHQYHRLPHERYFAAVQEIALAAGGRPHWGKLHTLDAAALRDRYPRFDDFLAVRDTLDPAGVFANPYLDRVLGPPRP